MTWIDFGGQRLQQTFEMAKAPASMPVKFHVLVLHTFSVVLNCACFMCKGRNTSDVQRWQLWDERPSASM